MKNRFLPLLILLLTSPSVFPNDLGKPESMVLNMLQEDKPYHSVSPDIFENLGWDLPDQGLTVKKLADMAPGGALDPHALESLSAKTIGYTARWHEVRYQKYGLDWDLTGLYLMPENPVAGMPTMVVIHGGSGNLYSFLLNPLNNPGLVQYLAQKVPVLLVTIPGNYRAGGWQEEPADRVPNYLLDKELGNDEIRVRNAAFTFQLVTDGIIRLVEETFEGSFVVVAHSTAGEIPYMLHGSRLKDRMHGRILGWGTGGTSHLTAMQDRWGYSQTAANYPPVDDMRPRPIENYSGDYLGPLNPVWEEGMSREDVARRWVGELEFQRRPRFKQPLQDMERRGAIPGMREAVIEQVRRVLEGNRFNVDVEAVVADLFAPMRAPLTGYSKIILTTAPLDTGHWNKDHPEESSTYKVVSELRELNPGIPVRALLFDVPMTHNGHIERPRQLAAGLYTGLHWLVE